ncbi:MAG: right-handed parallel beta-helix repeat-containing protein [Anaeroplasmataceae bacterium]|nr:right-handed parallel beta-helix repeat-containing protein [Anaeroplasmataceae bacterium]
MKKRIIASILVAGALGLSFFGSNLSAKAEGDSIIYVSPTGNKDNVGTKESPKVFNQNLLTAIKPGQTIMMTEGTYNCPERLNIDVHGKPDAYINVTAEEGARVILDFSKMEFDSANRGIQLRSNYWHFSNIEITGAGDNGMYIAGSHNIVENCQFYKNSDTGLQLGRALSSQNSINQWPSNNLIKNCTSFYNYDVPTLGENADGFAAKLTVGYGNVFDGCIAFRNSDDGWDLYAKQDSGCIGTVIIKNCLAFENGFLPEQRDSGEGVMTYDTTNGDGIGFKLGGGVMEGDVIIENSLAVNNKFHGISDNSNPGFIRLKNCTSINNGINVNEDGTVGERGIPGVKANYNNFDLARSTDSYNSYYGLLSFTDNQENFVPDGSERHYNEDMFRGSVAYSIFQTSYDEENKKEIYVSTKEFRDLSVYQNDNLPYLDTEHKQLTSNIFAEMTPYNAVGDKIFEIHKLLRNDDNSINIGNNYKLVDQELLTFVNGSPIGCDLAKSSYDEYDHYDLGDYSDVKNDSDIVLTGTSAVLEVATNTDAVYQNFELPLVVNGCVITWKSSDESIVKVGGTDKTSPSSTVYGTAYVSDPEKDTDVTLTATIHYGLETLDKEFVLHVKKRNSKIGIMTNPDGKDTYIVVRHQKFTQPEILVADGASFDNSPLDSSLYTLSTKYEWARSRDGQYVEVNDIYTSVPGVFRVTVTATLKADKNAKSNYTYYLFVGEDECEIDFVGGIHNVKVNSEGINISGSLTNIFGRIYVLVVDRNTTLYNNKTDIQKLMNDPDVQQAIISSDHISSNFLADNSSIDGYKVYYVISDRANKTFSDLRCKEIKTAEINTKDEFYNLSQGLGEYDQYTIYNLKQDLDFSDYTWPIAESPKPFKGVFNGNGHLISNINISTDVSKQAAVFYKLEEGTIMNVSFKEISVVNTGSSSKLTGIIGAMNGGYISYVKMENITAQGLGTGSTCVGGLVGQIIGGVNYIDHVSLNNDDKHMISATGKYAGGVIGNIQMDSGISTLEVYVSYCAVTADLGDGNDTGGCVAGIVGRTKNDSERYVLDINNCYYKGTIKTTGNYNAGILGSVEYGNGAYTVSCNYSDVVFIYCHSGIVVLDAKEIAKELVDSPEMEYQEYAHKNCNPICGRATTLSSDILGRNNLGSWEEYYSKVINSSSVYFDFGPDFIPEAIAFEAYLLWDIETEWLITKEGEISLRKLA